MGYANCTPSIFCLCRNQESDIDEGIYKRARAWQLCRIGRGLAIRIEQKVVIEGGSGWLVSVGGREREKLAENCV